MYIFIAPPLLTFLLLLVVVALKLSMAAIACWRTVLDKDSLELAGTENTDPSMSGSWSVSSACSSKQLLHHSCIFHCNTHYLVLKFPGFDRASQRVWGGGSFKPRRGGEL